MTDQTRTCANCGSTKPLDNRFFHYAYDRHGTGERKGFVKTCKRCVNDRVVSRRGGGVRGSPWTGEEEEHIQAVIAKHDAEHEEFEQYAMEQFRRHREEAQS